MTENTPGEPIKPIDDANPIEPVSPSAIPADQVPEAQPGTAFPADQVPPPPLTPDVLADVHQPVGSAYDPMPMESGEHTSRNWLGVVALIFGIIGGSVIAIVFGIIGLSAVRRGKATNKGMNIWGIVLGVIWSLVYIGVILALVVFVDNFKNTVEDAVKAQPGECYVSTITGTGELESANPTFGTCTGSENAVVYFVTDYTGTFAPGDADFAAELEALCLSDEAAAGVDTDKAASYYVEYYVPYADAWDTSPHTIVCGLSTESGPVDTTVLAP